MVGVFWALLYYVLFRFLITKFNIPTPGREEGEEDEVNVETKGTIAETAVRVLAALGGKENIEDCDACITRLRVAVKDITKVDKEAIKREGAAAVLEVKGGIQAIFGAKADLIKSKINDIIGED